MDGQKPSNISYLLKASGYKRKYLDILIDGVLHTCI